MAKSDEDNIDAILKSIREAIIDKEQRKYFEQFRTENQKKEPVFSSTPKESYLYRLIIAPLEFASAITSPCPLKR